MPLIVIILIIVLVNLYIVLLEKGPFTKPIGSRQFDLFKVYLEAEKSLLFIDQSAKYSLQQAIYELGQKGGSSEIDIDETPDSEYELYETPFYSRCGKYYGYFIWYKENGQNECIDENRIQSSLIYIFKINLDKYLERHPTNIPQNNYNYEIKNGIEIIGKAKESLRLDILKDENKPSAKEPIKTSEGLGDFTGKEKLCRKGKKCILASEAYNLLEKSQEKAAEKGTWIEVTDGYRSKEEQIAIWEGNTADNFKVAIPNESLRKKFVCYPYGNDVEQRCPHLTGNAVDVFLEGKTKHTMSVADFKLLYSIMSSAGWVRYTKEPWHFECCGTKRFEAAKAKGVTEIGEV